MAIYRCNSLYISAVNHSSGTLFFISWPFFWWLGAGCSIFAVAKDEKPECTPAIIPEPEKTSTREKRKPKPKSKNLNSKQYGN